VMVPASKCHPRQELGAYIGTPPPNGGRKEGHDLAQFGAWIKTGILPSRLRTFGGGETGCRTLTNDSVKRPAKRREMDTFTLRDAGQTTTSKTVGGSAEMYVKVMKIKPDD